jgi:ankyrin repeat protein
MAVDYDEYELLEWMLDKGADPNALAAVDSDGFGGHTALFGCVVSQPYRANRSGHERFAKLLLSRGADPTIRASLRKQLRFAQDETLHEFRNVNCIEWGEKFQVQAWVNPRALALIRAALR